MTAALIVAGGIGAGGIAGLVAYLVYTFGAWRDLLLIATKRASDTSAVAETYRQQRDDALTREAALRDAKANLTARVFELETDLNDAHENARACLVDRLRNSDAVTAAAAVDLLLSTPILPAAAKAGTNRDGAARTDAMPAAAHPAADSAGRSP